MVRQMGEREEERVEDRQSKRRGRRDRSPGRVEWGSGPLRYALLPRQAAVFREQAACQICGR